MKKISIIFLFFLLYLNAYPEARKPIEILADSMVWNKKLGQAIATGNAKAVQGQTTIKANKIIALIGVKPFNGFQQPNVGNLSDVFQMRAVKGHLSSQMIHDPLVGIQNIIF